MAKNVFDAFCYRLRWWNKKGGEKLSDPEIEQEIDLDDAENELANFTSQVTELVANNMRLTRERSAEQEKFDGLKNACKQIKTDRDAVDQATDAEKYAELDEKLTKTGGYAVSSQQKIASYDSTIADNQKTIDALKIEISNYQVMISDSKNKFDQLKAENSSVKLRKSLLAAKSGMDSGNSAIAKLHKFEEYVEHQKDQAAAMEDMQASSESGTVDSILKEYGTPKKSQATEDFLNSL